MDHREEEFCSEVDESQEQSPAYTPASIYKRIWAWVGVAYMVIVIFLVTWFISTGSLLTGLTGIMLFPLLCGFSIVKAVQAKREFTYISDRIGPILWSVLSGIAAVASLIWGILQIIEIFG